MSNSGILDDNASSMGTITAIDGDTGSASPVAGVITISGDSTGLTTTASGSTLDLTGTLAVNHGGTGQTTLTNHGVLVGAGTTAITQLAAGSSGQVLQSGGASADPAYSTATYPATATGTGTILRADGTNWSATTATYPNTTTINQILYSSAANTVSGLATANSAVLATNASGVPSITATPTVTSITFGSGNALNTYVTNTWTPNLQINGSSTGITYTTQFGGYTQIGNTITFFMDVILSSKGSSTGNVTISNFPITFGTFGGAQAIPCGNTNLSVSGVTTLSVVGSAGTTTLSFVTNALGTGAVANLTNSNITNTFSFMITGTFLTF